MYNEEVIKKILLLDDLRKLLIDSDIDKFTYFYNNSEYGLDCLFTKTAYTKIQEKDIVATALSYIEEIREQERLNKK